MSFNIGDRVRYLPTGKKGTVKVIKENKLFVTFENGWFTIAPFKCFEHVG
jgi:hypothetical protein